MLSRAAAFSCPLFCAATCASINAVALSPTDPSASNAAARTSDFELFIAAIAFSLVPSIPRSAHATSSAACAAGGSESNCSRIFRPTSGVARAASCAAAN